MTKILKIEPTHTVSVLNSRERAKGKLQKWFPADQQDVGDELPEDWEEWPHHLQILVEFWAGHHRYKRFKYREACGITYRAVLVGGRVSHPPPGNFHPGQPYL